MRGSCHLPFSFAPVTAALLYFGARRPRKEMWIPVAVLAAAGVYLSRSVYGYAFSTDLLVTWAWYAGMVLLGGMLAKNASALRVGAASLAVRCRSSWSATLLCGLSGACIPRLPAVWRCATLPGLPFFRNAVVSDLFFAAACSSASATW